MSTRNDAARARAIKAADTADIPEGKALVIMPSGEMRFADEAEILRLIADEGAQVPPRPSPEARLVAVRDGRQRVQVGWRTP